MSAMVIHKAQQHLEGVGVRVNRLFPVAGKRHHDPFVLWDDFAVPPSAGFPDHPHRGFEAITYVTRGSMKHTDNLGNSSTVSTGGLQCFTAGRGIIHSEMPSADEATQGIQLWINLRQQDKQLEPAYQQVEAGAVPEYEITGGRVRVLAGEGGALQLHTPVRYLDVKLDAGHAFSESLPPDYRGLVYVLAGHVMLADGQAELPLKGTEAGLYESGQRVALRALAASHLLLCFGRPHNEPIRQHGTFVD